MTEQDFDPIDDLWVIPPGAEKEIKCDFGMGVEGDTRDGYAVRLTAFEYTLNGEKHYVCAVDIPQKEQQHVREEKSHEDLVRVAIETLELLTGKKK